MQTVHQPIGRAIEHDLNRWELCALLHIVGILFDDVFVDSHSRMCVAVGPDFFNVDIFNVHDYFLFV